MRRYLWITGACVAIAVLCLLQMGCMTANQLEAEKAFYQAKVAMQQQKAAQPIVQILPAKSGEPITLGNVGSFTVFAPTTNDSGPGLTQYQQKDYVQPWLNIVAAAVPWLGSAVMVTNVANAFRDVAVAPNTVTNTTTNTSTTIDASGGSAVVAGSSRSAAVVMPISIDQTATPIILEPAGP